MRLFDQLRSFGRRFFSFDLIKKVFLVFLLFFFGRTLYKHAVTNFSGVLLILTLCLLVALVSAFLISFDTSKIKRLGWNSLLVICSLAIVLSATEVTLFLLKKHAPVSVSPSIPDQLRLREIEGTNDYFWHGKKHTRNQFGFRGEDWAEEKKANVLRIWALGDSLTFGEGVADSDVYPHLIEIGLQQDFKVEVLNLGQPGRQSEEIAELVNGLIDKHEPDLVLYGLCHNDFLPAGKDQYNTRDDYSFPLPKKLKASLLVRTELGKFLEDRYNRFLLNLGWRADFIDDILEDFRSYQGRFSRDMRRINEIVTDRTGLPTISLVLNQHPRSKRNRRLSRIAERYMKDAGMTVIPAEPYELEYATKKIKLHVSQWEGHPNEKAHRVFAGLFLKEIKENPLYNGLIDDYRKKK